MRSCLFVALFICVLFWRIQSRGSRTQSRILGDGYMLSHSLNAYLLLLASRCTCVCVCVCAVFHLLSWSGSWVNLLEDCVSLCQDRAVGMGMYRVKDWISRSGQYYFVNNFRKCTGCILSDIHSLVHHISQTSRGSKVFSIELSLVMGLKGWN